VDLRQVVELAALISAHSPNLIEAQVTPKGEALARYRDCSQVRTRNWLAALNDLPRELTEAPAALRQHVWLRAETTLVDVMAGGLVARVWGAVLAAADRSHRTLAAERIAHGALAGQLQAQQMVLQMLVDGPHLTLERVVRLDRLRRKIERWCDLLVGHLVRRFALAEFAFDLERALDFGEEQLAESWGPRRHRLWDMYFLCARSAFPDVRLPSGVQGHWREQLFQSILTCFPPELFLDDGMLKSVRLQRLLNAGSRREGPPMPGRFAGARLGRYPGKPGGE